MKTIAENRNLKNITIFFAVLISCNVFAQTNKNATRGIYKNLTELEGNTPSLSMTDTFLTKKMKYGFWGLTSKDYLHFQTLPVNAKQAKEVGKIFAFSDGKDVFIKLNNLRLFRRSWFAKTSETGKFYTYTALGVHVDSRLPFLWWTFPQEKFINYKNGKRTNLWGVAVRKLIKDNTSLFTEFKKDKKRGSKLKEYLLAYSSNQPSITKTTSLLTN